MDEKKDDELIIDFSKIKGFFSKFTTSSKESVSSKASEKTTESEAGENPADNEITFDPAAMKKFFSAFFSNPKMHLVLWLLIPLIITLYIRLLPASVPAADYFAENSVYTTLQERLADQVNQKFPNLPDANKQNLVQQDFTKLVQENKALIDQQITATAGYFRNQFTYESGDATYPYLGDIDSYYWLRYARNILTKGSYCDKVVDGRCVDTYTMAPLDLDAYVTLHPYAIVVMYKIFSIFSSSLTLMQASFYTPTLFALLSVVCAFFIVRRFTNNFGGFAAGLLVATSPMYITRALGSDTDVYNVFFPLLILWLFVEAFESGTPKKEVIFAALAGLATFIFAYSWDGWWFFLDLVIGTLGLYMAYLLIKQYYHHNSWKAVLHHSTFKRSWIILMVFLLVCGTLVSVFINWRDLLSVIAPLTFKPKEAANPDLWPNVLTTVAEFNPESLSGIIKNVSGGLGVGARLVFILAVLGIAFSFVNRKHFKSKDLLYLIGSLVIALVLLSQWALDQPPLMYLFLLALPALLGIVLRIVDKEEVTIREGILITLWMLGSIYASTIGVRFILLLVPPFALSVATALGQIYEMITQWFTKEFKLSLRLVQWVVGILLLLTIIAPVKAGYSVALVFVPSVNDAWYNTLTKIQQESQPDAIINSWWDFGHWFKYYADRRVTLDGSSQNAPPLHWLGNILLTANEQQAVAMLRMLDCGSNNAFETINKKINFTPTALQIVNDIILLPQEKAQQYLVVKGFTHDEIKTIVSYTHCAAPENYFITSSDMIGKAAVWSHFGSWNFSKAWVYYTVREHDSATATKEISQQLGMSSEYAGKLYAESQGLDADRANSWIAPWLNYLSGLSPCLRENDTIVCANHFILNLTNGDGYLVADQGNQHLAKAVYVNDRGAVAVQQYHNVTVRNRDRDLAMVIIPEGIDRKGYRSIIMDIELAESMFTRLFFLKGQGLRCFDLFDAQREVTGGTIFTWKVDWNCTTANNVYANPYASETTNETHSRLSNHS